MKVSSLKKLAGALFAHLALSLTLSFALGLTLGCDSDSTGSGSIDSKLDSVLIVGRLEQIEQSQGLSEVPVTGSTSIATGQTSTNQAGEFIFTFLISESQDMRSITFSFEAALINWTETISDIPEDAVRGDVVFTLNTEGTDGSVSAEWSIAEDETD